MQLWVASRVELACAEQVRKEQARRASAGAVGNTAVVPRALVASHQDYHAELPSQGCAPLGLHAHGVAQHQHVCLGPSVHRQGTSVGAYHHGTRVTRRLRLQNGSRFLRVGSYEMSVLVVPSACHGSSSSAGATATKASPTSTPTASLRHLFASLRPAPFAADLQTLPRVEVRGSPSTAAHSAEAVSQSASYQAPATSASPAVPDDRVVPGPVLWVPLPHDLPSRPYRAAADEPWSIDSPLVTAALMEV